VGHWYPIVSIGFHEDAMNGMMVLRQGYALVLDLPMRGSLAKGCTAQDGGGKGTWKVCDYTEGGDCIARGTV